jgi:hypothetical protein
MKRGAFRLAAAVGAIAAIGMTAGVGVYVAAPGGEEEVSPEAHSGTRLGSGTALDCAPMIMPASPVPTPSKGVPLPDPHAGSSDSERMALYERLRAEGEARLAAWLACLDTNRLDLHSLARSGINIEWAPGELSPPDAVAKADAIVVGNVTGFSPTPSSGTNTTFAVSQMLKGSPTATLAIMQIGGLSPTEDGTGVTISEAGNGAMLLPSDHAVLLLQKDGEGGYYIQGVSGWFQIVDGVVRANYFNEWRGSVEGKTEAEFVDMIKAALQ